VMLLALSLIHPAQSHAPADLDMTTGVLSPDWYYMALYPVFDIWGPAVAWAAAIGLSVLLSIMPWMVRYRRPQAAVVSPPDCNGCGNCSDDCPFGAVTIRPRTDGSPHREIAVVQPEVCTGCGICVASCPHTNPFHKGQTLSTGIDLPNFAFDALRKQAAARAGALDTPIRIMVFGCDHGAQMTKLKLPGVATMSLPCSGMLPPSMVDYLLTRKLVDGVIITACRPGECFHRLGPEWTEKRFAGERVPKLRKAVPRDRMRVIWAASTETPQLAREIAQFREELAATPVKGAAE
jgi:ferredoxin/coenzyme F420-reducing hydrogenase delta subunit